MKAKLLTLLFALVSVTTFAAGIKQTGWTTTDDAGTARDALAVRPDLTNGVVAVLHTNGASTFYFPLANTDAGRGTNLSLAFSNVVSGETLHIGAGNYLVHSMANLLLDGVTYKSHGAYIYVDSSSTSARGGNYANWLFYSDQPSVSNWKFLGPVTLDGNNSGTKSGIVMQTGQNRLIRDVTFVNWPSNGLWMAAGGATDHLVNLVESCRATNCGTGFKINAEYSRLTDCSAFDCTNGFMVTAGNNRFVACSGADNVTALTLATYGNVNPGHGVWLGGDLNHNTTNLFVSDDFARGFTFVGAHAYVGVMRVGGQGFQWLGGDIASTLVMGKLTNIVSFDSVVFPQGRDASFTNAGVSNIYFMHCRTLTNWFTNSISL